MSRPECAGKKDDRSDRCDLYDSEGFCHWYGDTWKDDDGVYRGGEEVERITYCTHRTIKGKPINWGTNPLIMDRICHWTEVMFDGEVRSRHHDLYNQNGIIVWGDGTMHDPVTKKTICADGTVIEDDHWGGNLANRKSFEFDMECLKRKTNKKSKSELKQEEPSKQYQTYLPKCDCGSGVLIKDGKLYCRWCRTPYGEGAMIDYKDSHFKRG